MAKYKLIQKSKNCKLYERMEPGYEKWEYLLMIDNNQRFNESLITLECEMIEYFENTNQLGNYCIKQKTNVDYDCCKLLKNKKPILENELWLDCALELSSLLSEDFEPETIEV